MNAADPPASISWMSEGKHISAVASGFFPSIKLSRKVRESLYVIMLNYLFPQEMHPNITNAFIQLRHWQRVSTKCAISILAG